MIESYLLEYFMAVYEEGTILKASEKLHVSQPSITKAIQKLESELSLSLFDRLPNKITLNENGKIIADYIKDAILIDERIREKAKELRIKSETIKVELTAPGPTFKFPDFFYFSNKKYPNTVEIKDEKTCIKDVISGICDIAFINSNYKDERIYTEKIFDENLYVSLPKTHFLAKKNTGLTFQELDGQSFLIVRELGIWYDITLKNLKKSKLFKIDDNAITDVISASTIPSFVTNITLKYREFEDRIPIPILDKEATLPFYVIVRKDKLDIYEKIKKIG